jgi:hypothetical protein
MPPALADIPGLVKYDGPDPCVYFLCRDGEVVYVGQTLNIGARVRAHRRGDKRFDTVYVLRCAASEMRRMELEFIRQMKPEYNAQGTGRHHQADSPWDSMSPEQEEAALSQLVGESLGRYRDKIRAGRTGFGVTAGVPSITLS